jgi:hypothetical protein
MANKLAGQKAKFTRARTAYYSTEDENTKRRALEQMAAVLEWAQHTAISEAEVTQGYEFPDEARRTLPPLGTPTEISDTEAERYEREIESAVDTSGMQERGSGAQCVYAYGYRAAPGLLKIGRCDKDVVFRITSQINTSTPGKPILWLLIKTDDCRSLEKALHGILQVRCRKEPGGGDEWFRTDVEELLEIHSFCMRELAKPQLVAI